MSGKSQGILRLMISGNPGKLMVPFSFKRLFSFCQSKYTYQVLHSHCLQRLLKIKQLNVQNQPS